MFRKLNGIRLFSLLLASLPALPSIAATESAQYEVRFDATWSASTHPREFPSNPHFSDLIGGVHNAEVSFWQPGGQASPGIQAMAERGRTTPLDNEVLAAVGAGTAKEVIHGGSIGVSPGSATATFTASLEYPLATVVTMIAPSPDWFVGVRGLSLFENGDWVLQKKVTLYGWDAGTDDGPSYASENAPSSPHQPISALDSGVFAGTGALGTLTFVRLDVPAPERLHLRGGRFEVELEYEDYQGTRGVGVPHELTEDTGYFHFFDANNVEVVLKVLDGCGVNGHFWVFAGGLTDVGVSLKVVDKTTQVERFYGNTLGQAFVAVRDAGAFTCP